MTSRFTTVSSRVTPAKKYQASRQPSSPPPATRRGTRGPARTMAKDEPVGTIDDAKPTRRTSNQAAMRPIAGTRIMPLPMPVTSRPSEAPAKPSEKPVMSMPTAVVPIPMVRTKRGPSREASTPPTAAVMV